MHAARLHRSPRLKRVHGLLGDGAERSTLEIITGARVCAVNACIAELRANGAEIACRQTVSARGERIWLYRMVRPAPPSVQGEGRTPAPPSGQGEGTS